MIAHYTLTSMLGEGGMGQVFQATDRKLGREVAIKILPDSMTGSERILARFKREAKVLASLNHPNIATIFGIEDCDDSKAIVMELVEGETLGERLKKGPMTMNEALGIFQQIASALEAAHEKGIIHRDLKPGNIKFTSEGHAKVLDFGLAKAMETSTGDGNQNEPGTIPSDMTMPGTVMGTPAYMSPEQTRGEEVDKRTDVWAFGCCLYECLTGRKPFQARTISDLMAEVLRSDPDFTIVPPETPHEVLSLLSRCLEKEPRRRLRDLGDIAIHLEESAKASRQGSQTSNPTENLEVPAKPGAGRWLGIGLACAVAGAALFAVLQPLWKSPDKQVVDSARSIRSLAILRFDDLNAEEGNGWVSDTMAEEIQAKLLTLDRLTVRRVHRSFNDLNALGQTVQEVAQELNVDALVEGNFLHHQGGLRIRVSLHDGTDGQDQLLGTFTDDANNVLPLQGEVALAIAKSIQFKLSEEERAAIAQSKGINPKAYEKVRRGLVEYDRYTSEGFKKAEEYFSEALRIDPGYGEALALLARNYYAPSVWGGGTKTPERGIGEARRIIDESKAGIRDPNSLLAMEAWITLYGERDWVSADQKIRRALKVDDDNPNFFLSRALYLNLVEGRTPEALEFFDAIMELEPDRLAYLDGKADSLKRAGEYRRALDVYEEILSRDPDHWEALSSKARIHAGFDEKSQALEAANRAVALSNRNPTSLARRANAYALLGMEPEAREDLVELENLAKSVYVDRGRFADVYGLLGEMDRAIEILFDEASRPGGWSNLELRAQSRIELYGRDPRYWQLIDQLKFPSLPLSHPSYELEQGMRFGKGDAAALPSNSNIRKLAVLPFKSLAGTEEKAYYADAISELISVKLGMIDDLGLTGYTSMRRFKSSEKSIPDIARELDRDAIVTGSVIRMNENDVIITASLLDGISGESRWGAQFGPSADLPKLQGEVILAIANNIKALVTPERRGNLVEPDRVSREAYDSYLECLTEKSYTEESLRRRLVLSESAIAADPHFAPAYAQKAFALNTLVYWGFEHASQGMKEVKAALNEALRLDPDLGEAHAVSGAVSLYSDRRFQAVEQSFKLALKSDPNLGVTYVNYGALEGLLGRSALSIQYSKKAVELDPLNSEFIQSLGWAYYRSKDYDRALESGRRVIEIDPESFIGYHVSAFALTAMGRDQEAETNLRLAYQMAGQEPFYMARLGYELGVLGKNKEARGLLGQLEEVAENNSESVKAFHFGLIHIGLGNDDQALEWFDKALQDSDMDLIYLGSNFYFDGNRQPLRENPKYKPLLRKLGLPE